MSNIPTKSNSRKRGRTMTNKPKPFKEVYFSSENEVVDSELIIEDIGLDKNNLGKYMGNILCPECRVPKLSFVNKTSKRCAYFRRFPSEMHEEDCSYNFVYAKRNVIKTYIESLSYNQIQDKLNAIMNMLFRIESYDGVRDIRETSMDIDNNITDLKNKPERQDKISLLRTKELNTRVKDSHRGGYILFYGKVKLKVTERKTHDSEGKTKMNYMLEIINLNKKTGEEKFRTRLDRGEIKDDINDDAMYHIAMVGQVGKKLWQITLANIHAIRFYEYD